LSPKPIEFPAEGLSDGVVRLRLLADADLPAIVEAVQDPEIPRWTTVPAPYGDDEARQWQRSSAAGLAAGTDLATLVVDADDGRLLGAMGIHGLDRETGRCSAGYWLAAGERRRGIASRGLTLLCRYSFGELGVKRIELWIQPENTPSLGVAERVGFHREGLLRSFMPIDGQRRDMLMYSLLPGDLT
jgi:RimJ/RimL family protein N-acetyltransferase